MTKSLLSTGLLAFALRAQQIDTVAGTGAAGFAGDGGPAKAALLDAPRALTVNPAGELFILDYGNNRVRKVSPEGTISTVAGNGGIGLAAEGKALQTPFIALYSVAWRASDSRLYIGSSDGLHAVDGGGEFRAVVPDRSVPAVDTGGPAVLIGEFLRILRLEANGELAPVAGDGDPGDSGDGGPALQARFNAVTSIAADRLGRVWSADVESHRVRRFTPGGDIVTIAGKGIQGFGGDGGRGSEALLDRPAAIAVDVAGNLYIADTANYRIRRVRAADGVIDTLAGNGKDEPSGDGGPAMEASFGALAGLTVNCAGVYVSDLDRVRLISLPDPLIALRGIADEEKNEPYIRPGKAFRIEGCNLAERSERAVAGEPLPTRLGGVEVLVNGIPASLAAVSPARIEARVTEGTAAAAQAAVRVVVVMNGKSVETTAEIR